VARGALFELHPERLLLSENFNFVFARQPPDRKTQELTVAVQFLPYLRQRQRPALVEQTPDFSGAAPTCPVASMAPHPPSSPEWSAALPSPHSPGFVPGRRPESAAPA
jgi:hypothetical protein